jgi:hypothetical protein
MGIEQRVLDAMQCISHILFQQLLLLGSLDELQLSQLVVLGVCSLSADGLSARHQVVQQV